MPGDGGKDQEQMRIILVAAASLLLGILIIFNLYEGVVSKGYTNENIGIAYNNSVTYLLTDNTPISSSGIVVRNSTGGIILEQAVSPGWQLVDPQTGRIEVNYTGGI